MSKREKMWVKPTDCGFRPSVLIDGSKSGGIDSYADMSNAWRMVLCSIRVPRNGNFLSLRKFEYNRKGEVRTFRGGVEKKIKVYPKSNRFLVDGLDMYMPKPEICAGNGTVSYRFDTFLEASYFLGFDSRRAAMHGFEIDGWRVEMGWPQPYVIGHGKRVEEYAGLFSEMRKACEGKENKKNIKPYWDEDGE